MNKQKFDQLVDYFATSLDKNGNKLQMHSFAIKQKDTCFLHRFNQRTDPSDVRSLSKTVLALAAGKVIDLAQQGLYPEFNEDTLIFPIIENAVNLTNQANLKYLTKIKIKHLLTHTVGYDKILLMRGDIKDMNPFTYLDYLVNYPIKYEPGKIHLYSNAGFYLLSVVLQEFIGEDLFDFIERELFEPLAIKDATWVKYGNYLAGATRLWLQPEDLIKIGELLLNKGAYQEKQILPASWIEKMTAIKAYSSNFDPTARKYLHYYAYGYGIWIAKENLFFASGTDGQYIVVIPEKNAIIVTQAEQKDTMPIKQILDQIIAHDL
ncbi:MAG TPA: serine hydrolase [Clostridiaceae bacterium]|nr:serine hydrolase [Clostridiaceae bacterium]